MVTPKAPDLDTLAEDVADLRAEYKAFATQLERNTRIVDNLRDSLPVGTAEGADGKPPDKPATGPTFILRLDGAEYDAELGALETWVRHLLVPSYVREVSAGAPWCAQWWDHAEAVGRLHALWLAWMEHTTPETAGWTGPATWHRDHLDSAMAQLRSPAGPFAACMTNPERQQHRPDRPAPLATFQPRTP